VSRRPAARPVLAALGALVLLASCSSTPPLPGGGTANAGHGPVDVLYAGSLADLMENHLGPAFAAATGYQFAGYGAGSGELVSDIKTGTRTADVFISASPSADAALEGAANGNHVAWYSTFGAAPLVIGYNRSSRFAAAFASEPWYQVVTQTGILVGRTDPTLDPKGKLTVQAVDDAATLLGMPQLTTDLSGWPVFPEQTLVGRLESGQLDCGFFYSFEATAQKIPTVSLSPIGLSATFTVTIVSGAPHGAAAQAFVAYLLGPSGRALLQAQGIDLQQAALTGPASAVPPGLRSLVGG
jgi:molybdate/tungstate transport system substrate-binding protein